MKLRTLLRVDSAENSIMQTITIAVSAILIAAGLVTAPGLINNARDNNARTDLANIAYGQEFALSNVGHYYRYITAAQEEEATGSPSTGDNLIDSLATAASATSVVRAEGGGLKFTLSGNVSGHEARTCSTPEFYLLKAQSSSGKWFYRASGSALTTSDFSKIVVPSEVTAVCPDITEDWVEEPTDGGGDPGDGGGDNGGGGNDNPGASVGEWQTLTCGGVDFRVPVSDFSGFTTDGLNYTENGGSSASYNMVTVYGGSGMASGGDGNYRVTFQDVPSFERDRINDQPASVEIYRHGGQETCIEIWYTDGEAVRGDQPAYVKYDNYDPLRPDVIAVWDAGDGSQEAELGNYEGGGFNIEGSPSGGIWEPSTGEAGVVFFWNPLHGGGAYIHSISCHNIFGYGDYYATDSNGIGAVIDPAPTCGLIDTEEPEHFPSIQKYMW